MSCIAFVVNKSVSNFVTCDSIKKFKHVTLTNKMYDQLVKLLNSQKVDENVNPNMLSVFLNSACVKTSIFVWLFDSGAADHMFSDLNVI